MHFLRPKLLGHDAKLHNRMKKEYLIALLVLALLAVLGAYFTLKGQSPETPSDSTASTTPTTTITGGGYTIEQFPVDDIRDSMPSLAHTIAFSDGVPAEVRALIEKNAAAIVNKLEQDPTQVSDWLQLALLYHTANDSKGAKEVWEFLVKVIPEDTTSYDNLGKLYHFNLKDYPKAESYFKQSIAIAPTSATSYFELFTLYRYSYKKETTAAVDILAVWAKAVPQSPDPYFTLGLYYRDLGKIANAKVALTTAMDKARAAGNLDLMSQIGVELQKLSP